MFYLGGDQYLVTISFDNTRLNTRIPHRLAAGLALLAFTFCSVAQALSAAGTSHSSLWLDIDGVSYEASLSENSHLIENRVLRGLPSSFEDSASHFKGQILGFSDSAVRLTYSQGRWRGVVIINDLLYEVDHQLAEAGHLYSPVPVRRLKLPAKEQHLCDKPQHSSAQILADASTRQLPSESIDLETGDIRAPAVSFSVAGEADCPDPVYGVCLMPELEIAYDLSYQAISSSGETVLDRATRELNELDLFFERSFNYRFSRVTMTFLDASQDAVFSSYDSADALLDALRVARTRGELPFVQSPRSIFHFMTGRDFPPDEEDRNIVGIAYLDVFCETFGLNTGLTDAGDAFLVSLVMAHEIGHNLGAEHDVVTENGCSANTHVMTASIGSGAFSITDFSSCSAATIQPIMSGILSSSNRPQCLDFPVDISISEVASNIAMPPRAAAFTTDFILDKRGGELGRTRLEIEGVIGDPSTGRWLSSSVDGGVCSVGHGTYSCVVDNANELTVLSITAIVENSVMSFSHTQTVNVVDGETADVETANNVITTLYTEFGEPITTAIDVDVSIRELEMSTDLPVIDEPFTVDYLIEKIGDESDFTDLQIDGSVSDPAFGGLQFVELSGGSCSVTDDTYSCIVSNVGDSAILSVTAVVDDVGPSFALAHTVSVVGGETIDTQINNNSITTMFTDFIGNTSTSGGAQQGAGNEPSGGSSGGGGATELFYLILLALRCSYCGFHRGRKLLNYNY